MPQSQDLFDDSTMTFGEHLEVLRVHLIRALFGLVVGTGLSLGLGNRVVDLVRWPLDNALEEYNIHVTDEQRKQEDAFSNFDLLGTAWNWITGGVPEEAEPLVDPDGDSDSNADPETGTDAGTGTEGDTASDADPIEPEPETGTITVEIGVAELLRELHTVQPDAFPEPAEDEARQIAVPMTSKAFAEYDERILAATQPSAVTLTVQEAFMTFLKVSFVTGFVVSSPWIFYQAWLFVAAGLYPHERKYVYIYLPMSVTLFFTGAVFCFVFVFPFVLRFLLGFNTWLSVEPVIRLTEWINFAITLPLMFGISFQLPLVMLFLERISIFEVKQYQDQWRMAVLVIAVLSMFLTPADPASMLMMMCPLIVLYMMGILLCRMSPEKTPFGEEAAAA